MNNLPTNGIHALQLTCTRLASTHSTAAHVLQHFNLRKVVQLYLPACSEEQYQHLMRHIQQDVICVIPLKRGTRKFIYCQFLDDFNEEQNIFIYHLELETVFANQQGKLTQPYNVRVIQFANFEENIL